MAAISKMLSKFFHLSHLVCSLSTDTLSLENMWLGKYRVAMSQVTNVRVKIGCLPTIMQINLEMMNMKWNCGFGGYCVCCVFRHCY